jgi:hypothetical protein
MNARLDVVKDEAWHLEGALQVWVRWMSNGRDVLPERCPRRACAGEGYRTLDCQQ